MGRYKLLPALANTYRQWKQSQKQYSFIYCPICRNELSGDRATTCGFDGDEVYYYDCGRCHCKSEWSFDVIPGGFLIRNQRLTEKLYKHEYEPAPTKDKQ